MIAPHVAKLMAEQKPDLRGVVTASLKHIRVNDDEVSSAPSGLKRSRPLFHGGREDSLQVRTLLVAGNDGDIDFSKSGVLEHLVKLHFAKTQP